MILAPRKHDMILVTVHTSGAEEWHCPECGRRFIVNWPPNYQKIVLVAGDEYAYHSCHKGDATAMVGDGGGISAELDEALGNFFEELEGNGEL